MEHPDPTLALARTIRRRSASPFSNLLWLYTSDEQPLNAQPADDHFAADILVGSDLYNIFTRAPATDAELEAYVYGRIYWAKKFGLEPTIFQRWEARRFNVEPIDLDNAAFAESGRLLDAPGAESIHRASTACP